jgi:hypothetical protein
LEVRKFLGVEYMIKTIQLSDASISLEDVGEGAQRIRSLFRWFRCSSSLMMAGTVVEGDSYRRLALIGIGMDRSDSGK